MKALWKPSHLVLLAACLSNTACTSVGYYSQAVSGQANIFFKQRSVEMVIHDENTERATRQKLSDITDILDFAHHRLGLPDNGSYHNYVDLERRYVVWNVFAAPELSLQPKQWCYLVVGCMGYRGYFDESKAEQYAHSLQRKGWDVYVGGVSAYSTLGWFRDPVMNTMLDRDTWELARLIFHELAHQRLYIRDDTEVNEAFADAVALIGLELWLENRSPELRQSVTRELKREQAFIDLVLAIREELEVVYQSELPETVKRTEKKRIIDNLKSAYLALKHSWEGDGRYDSWVAGINNASLAALSTYWTLVPDFLRIYQEVDSSLERFYARVGRLKNCGKYQRLLELRKSGAISGCPP